MNERDLMQALERHAEAVHPGAAPLAEMTGRAGAARKRRTAVTALAAAAAVAIVATTLSLVGVDADKSSAPDVVSPGSLSGLDDALATLPGDASMLHFNNQAVAAKRLGFDTSSPEAYRDSLVEVVLGDATGPDGKPADPGGIYSPLASYFEVMADLPFNDYDVVWSAYGSSEAPSAIGLEGTYTIYRVSPETDLDAVADDLVAAGLEEDELRGRRHLFAVNVPEVAERGLIGDGYPIDFLDVTIDTEADLLITGRASLDVLEVLDGVRDSAAEVGTFDDVIGDLDQVERLSALEGGRCEGASGDVEKPESAGYLVHGEDAALAARVVLADETTAADDLAARVDYLRTGLFGDDEQPLAELGSFTATQRGAVVELEFTDMDSTVLADLMEIPGSILGC